MQAHFFMAGINHATKIKHPQKRKTIRTNKQTNRKDQYSFLVLLSYLLTKRSVPCIVTCSPRYVFSEGLKHVEKAPGDDHVVINGHQKGNHNHSKSNSCENKTQAKWSKFYI